MNGPALRRTRPGRARAQRAPVQGAESAEVER